MSERLVPALALARLIAPAVTPIAPGALTEPSWAPSPAMTDTSPPPGAMAVRLVAPNASVSLS